MKSQRELLSVIKPLKKSTIHQHEAGKSTETNRRAAKFAEKAKKYTNPQESLNAARDFAKNRDVNSALRLIQADPSNLATIDNNEREDVRGNLFYVLLGDINNKSVSEEAEQAAVLLLTEAPDPEKAKEAMLSVIGDGGDGKNIIDHVSNPILKKRIQEWVKEFGTLMPPALENGHGQQSADELGDILGDIAKKFRDVPRPKPPVNGAAPENPIPKTDDTKSPSEPPKKSEQGEINVDWIWIKGREGDELEGYVPIDNKTGNPVGESGVTIARGVDLGQWNSYQLRKMGIPEYIIAKLEPYLSPLRKEAAIAYLKDHPLVINEKEAKIINDKMRGYFEQLAATNFNTAIQKLRDSGDPAYANLENFENLPPEIQTAIVSLIYQYGIADKGRIKRTGLWDALISQDWTRVAEMLVSGVFDDRKVFQSRLKLTADLVTDGQANNKTT